MLGLLEPSPGEGGRGRGSGLRALVVPGSGSGPGAGAAKPFEPLECRELATDKLALKNRDETTSTDCSDATTFLWCSWRCAVVGNCARGSASGGSTPDWCRRRRRRRHREPTWSGGIPPADSFRRLETRQEVEDGGAKGGRVQSVDIIYPALEEHVRGDGWMQTKSSGFLCTREVVLPVVVVCKYLCTLFTVST